MNLRRPLLCLLPHHIFLYLLIPKKEKNTMSTRQTSNKQTSALLQDFLDQWSVSSDLLSLRGVCRGGPRQGLTGTKPNGNTLWKHKLQQLSKAGRKLSPQIFSDLSTRRERFQDEAISGKFLDLTSNYLLAISPADVMDSECVSHWKKLSRNISATQ